MYSLMPSERCLPDKLDTEIITYGGLVLHAPEVVIDLSFVCAVHSMLSGKFLIRPD